MRARKNRFIPSFIFECANFSMVPAENLTSYGQACAMFMCSIRRYTHQITHTYTLTVTLCKHFNLCALCYRALYRCHCTAYISTSQNSWNTPNNKMSENTLFYYIRWLWLMLLFFFFFGAAKLLWFCLLLCQFVVLVVVWLVCVCVFLFLKKFHFYDRNSM